MSVIVIALFIANAAKAQTGSRCSELAVTLDQLRLEIASVEAELWSLCNPQSNEARRLGAHEPNRTALMIQPTQSIEATGYNASNAVNQPGRANGAHPESGGRRRAGKGGVHATYAVECWAAGSAFLHDARCNCLGEPAHPKLGSRRTIKILLPSWYVRCSSCRVMLQAGFARATVGLSSGMCPPCAGRVQLWTPFCSRSLLRSALDIQSSCFRTASSQMFGRVSRSRTSAVVYTRH